MGLTKKQGTLSYFNKQLMDIKLHIKFYRITLQLLSQTPQSAPIPQAKWSPQSRNTRWASQSRNAGKGGSNRATREG